MCVHVRNAIILSKGDIYKTLFPLLIFLYKKISSCVQLISDTAKAKTIIKGVNAVSKRPVHAMGK